MYFFSVFDKTIFTRITRQVPLAGSRNCYPSRAREFTPSFSRIRVAQSLVFWVVLCRSSFAHVSFFFWPLCCLSFFDLHFWLPLWYLQTFNNYMWTLFQKG